MSLSKRTKKWLTANGLSSLKGKTVLITGANSGIGFKMMETMVYLGADVIMACRNLTKASAAKELLLLEYPDAGIHIMELDLADFASIDAFVEKLQEQHAKIDVFVNNAGVFHRPGQQTKDSLELVIGTNYFGTYYVSERIMPYLETLSHRVIYVNTISLIHKFASIKYDDFFYTKHYGNFRAYGRSKLCIARYTYALAKKYEGTNLHILMNHPGISITPMELQAFGKVITCLTGWFSGLFNSPEKSALSLAYIMAHDLPSGSIIGPNKLLGGWGYPKPNHIYRKVKEGSEELITYTEAEIEKTRF